MIKTQSVQSDPQATAHCWKLYSHWQLAQLNSTPAVCAWAQQEKTCTDNQPILLEHPPLKLGVCRMNMGQVCQFEHHFESSFQWTVLWLQATEFHTWFHQWSFWWVFLNWPSWIWMIYKAKAVKFFLHSRIVKWPPSRLSFLSGGIKHFGVCGDPLI